MMLPILNAIITMKDSLGNKAVPCLTADGKIQVEMTTTSAGFTTGATPPASPAQGDAWYNTAAGQNELYIYDSTCGFWLSANSTRYEFGNDSSDNAALRGSEIHNPGTGTGKLIPLDAMIVRIAADSRAGPATKGVDILDAGAGGASIIQSFSLAGNQFIDNALCVQLDANSLLWVQTQAVGGNALDLNVDIWTKWRIAP